MYKHILYGTHSQTFNPGFLSTLQLRHTHRAIYWQFGVFLEQQNLALFSVSRKNRILIAYLN